MTLRSKEKSLTVREAIGEFSIEELGANQRGFNNRVHWKRFSSCGVCQKKLMAYLEKAHTFEEIMHKLHEKHPEIQDIRRYTQHAIRQTTGMGIYDDYILEHHIWSLRKPILAPPPVRKALQVQWCEFARHGQYLIEMDRKAKETIDDELLRYIVTRARS